MYTPVTQRNISNNAQTAMTVITIILLLLWIPVSSEKLMDWGQFRSAMLRQPFAVWFRVAVGYTIPILEAGTALLLIFNKTRKIGFYFSFLLMLAFTGFVGLALGGFLKNALCNCAAVINGMDWKTHFAFNCSFLILSAYAIHLTKKKRH